MGQVYMSSSDSKCQKLIQLIISRSSWTWAKSGHLSRDETAQSEEADSEKDQETER